MSDLLLTFSEVYELVSEFLGYGSSPSGTNLTNCKNCVYSGLRRFLFPINARTGRKHTWSFLKKPYTLVTQSGQWQIELPKDFKEFHTPLQYDKDSGYAPPVKVSPEEILRMRALGTGETYPAFYALVRPFSGASVGNNWQIWFHGEPDNSYIMHSIYIVNPDKPSATTDVFVGGVEASEAILESCLSVAEQNYDEVSGIHTQNAEKLIQELILHDNVSVPETVGRFDQASVVRKRFLEALTEDDIYAD